ncbi:MAG TPA: sigma factor [Polyangiaceae bacterium]|nr:sigma factor [Polyangiaceae bacterium]
MKTRVADPTLRREVEAAVRRRVRGDEAEDVVQATLADVLSAASVPEQPEEFRRFVFGVARNKVFDHFRRQKRHTEGLDESQTAGPEAPLSARDILRWAEGELPDSESQSTLEWMLREGDGEKLEHIAKDAQVPATRVRKRVSRLRKLLRERWAAELMLLGLLALASALGLLYWLSRGKNPDDFVKREPVRPLPSAPVTPELRAPEPSRPAGDTAPDPSFVTPSPSNAVPSADQSNPQGKSDIGLPLDGNLAVKGLAPKGDSMGTNPHPKTARPRARPVSTEESSSGPAPQTVPDFSDRKETEPAPAQAVTKPTAPAAKPSPQSKATQQMNSSGLNFDEPSPAPHKK